MLKNYVTHGLFNVVTCKSWDLIVMGSYITCQRNLPLYSKG
jgi:hypothetical protein